MSFLSFLSSLGYNKLLLSRHQNFNPRFELNTCKLFYHSKQYLNVAIMKVLEVKRRVFSFFLFLVQDDKMYRGERLKESRIEAAVVDHGSSSCCLTPFTMIGTNQGFDPNNPNKKLDTFKKILFERLTPTPYFIAVVYC